MLGKRIINTGAVSCTTDTTQILDAGATQSKALYRFEDDVFDTSESTGKFGKGASFDGYNSAIDANNVSGLNSLTGVSVSLWFNWDDSTSVSNYNHMVNIGDMTNTGHGDAFGIAIGDDGGSYNRVLYGYFPEGSQSTGQTVTANTWHHVVITYSGTTVKYYYDGSLVATQTKTSLSLPSSGNGIFIGHYKFNGNHHFKGFLDQIRIFNKEISSSEVTTLYNETTSTVSTLQVLGDTSCIAAYTFEGNANDLSTNYNGTASNVRYDYSGTASNITYTTGKFGKAAVFNGSNSVIDITNMRTVMNNDFAVSFWHKTPSTFATSGYPALISMYGYLGYGSAYGWDIEYASHIGSGDKLSFYWVSSSGVGNYIQSNSLSADTWYHIVCQKNASSAAIYVNGVSSNSGSSISSYAMYYNNFNRMTIGAKRLNYGSTSSHVSGLIDQVRLFTKQLNAGEINSLYNETATTAALATIDNPSTIAYYKMQDATDETGSYNGTPTDVDFNVQGKYGFAGKFNGSSSRINTGLTWPGGTEISCSLWINTAGGVNQYILGSFNDSGSNSTNRLAFQFHNSNVLYILTNDASGGMGTTTNAGSIASYLNKWTHIVVTVNGTEVKAYLDGSLFHTSTGTALAAGSYPFIIGAYTDNSNRQNVNGKIDQVRIFNKAISASEVTTLYNEIQCANTIDTPESYFNTKLYTGNGSTQALTGVGFAPAFVWIKARSVGYSHSLQDTVRGPGTGTSLYSDLQSAQGTYGSFGQISAFGADGFTVASGGHASYPTAQVNQNGVTYASWNWKGASSSVTNNVGTITSTVSASPESGFSIVKYTATGTIITNTVGHGLTTKPSLIIQKGANSTSNWFPITDVIDGSVDYLMLNSTGAKGDMSGIYANFSINDTTFTNWYSNTSGEIITYCFANVDGYQRIGSYVGTGGAGPFVYTGFEPAWLMIKETSNTGNWCIYDNKRDTVNPNSKVLAANSSNAESYYSSGYNVNFHTNGFEIAESSSSDLNTSGSTYLFWAIAANPDTTAPTKANSFKTVLYTGTGSSQSITGTGFKPDLTWIKNRANGVTNSWHTITDSVRGGGTRLWPNATNAEAADNYDVLSFQNDGFTIGTGTYSSYNGGSFVSWNWKGLDHDRNLATINNDGSITSLVSANPAAGFSVVKWTGTGVDGTKIGHGLQGPPEIIITKGLSNATSWVIGVGNISGFSINDYFTFTAYAKANSSTFYQAYSTNTFQVGVSAANEMNKSSSNQYISYCFRTIAGHSSIGSYTGNGTTTSSTQTINVGFQPQFVMIKNSSSASTNWVIIDSLRDNGDEWLYPNTSDTAYDDSNTYTSFASNGFTVSNTASYVNANGSTYIYMAFK